MQSKGVVRFFLIALSVVCLYQFGLMIPTNNVENKAKSYANECSQSGKKAWQACYSHFLDSVSTDTIFRIPGIKAFNYADLKKSQLALGLDLKGGMSVLLQVDLRDFLSNLSGNTTDPSFKAALDKATELQKTQQADYITLFAQAWRETSGGKPLASIFSRNQSLKDQIKYDSPDADVVATLRSLANSTVDETYKRLKQRIDKLGVIQPNVSLDASRDLILVELPGIDNPERARKMLQQSAKLEFWETYRLGDEGLMQAFATADRKLKAMKGGDTTATKVVQDTTWSYPLGANGQPDSTQPKIASVAERVDTTQDQTAGPLFSVFYPNVQGGTQSPVIGWADRNQRAYVVDSMLARPEIAQIFPANIKFVWSQKPIGPGQGQLSGKYELYAVKKYRSQETPRLDGSVVTDASKQPDPSGAITVSLSMNDDGAREWEKMTAEAYQAGQREIAIVLDDEVVSAPSVRGRIAGGTSSISGNFSLEEAEDLANVLEVGKLPADAHIVQESQVGPSLGAENINKSLITMILSVALLCVFMFAYYNKGGLVSVVALLANIFFIIGTLASMGTVLTLPGIAGIVLTLAAAVDANVIIFERIREELRHGMGLRQAVSTGFSRALPAILDANLAHVLIAVVLIYFGLGPIKGFGTVLVIGVITSLFTAVLVGRYITEWWLDRGGDMQYSRPWSEKWLVGFHYDWMGKRKYAYIFSLVLTVIAFGSFFTRGFELGVDFRGGYSFNVQFDRPVDIEQLRGPLTESLQGNPVIKAVNTENTYNITTSYLIDERGPEVVNQVITKLHEGLSAAGIDAPIEQFKRTDGSGTHITSSSQVGPTVADDIRNSSFLSAAWALGLMFLYLLMRFRRWQFSLGAIIALFHDVTITLGLFSLLHGLVPFSLEVDQAIIACILTVIGFSVNDTVIVYDRIREFIHTYTGRPKEEVLNLAINTTLSRTLITSGTVIAVVLLLFLFGGSAIKGFSFGMLVGMAFGTYSSIFIASALVVDMTREKVLSGRTVEAQPTKEEKAAKPTAAAK
jgi:SecD/SecF fusion protein